MATILHSYDCGAVQNTVTADLYDNGILDIHGNGNIANYTSSTIPWYSQRNNINIVKFSSGILYIGNYLLSGCINIVEIIMNCNPPTLGTTPFNGLNNLKIQYDPLLESWTSSIRISNYGGAVNVQWVTPDRYLLSKDGLIYMWNKIKNWININKSKVSVTRNLTSGTKIATITVDNIDIDLYCNINTDVENDTYNSLNTSNKTLIGAINELSQRIDNLE